MSQTTKTFFIILLTAALACFVTYEFMNPAPQVSIAPLEQQVKTEQSRLEAINKLYALDVKKLQLKNDSLMKVVKSDKVILTESDLKVSKLESKVSKLADTIRKEPDTVKSKIALSDSLSKDVAVLVVQERSRDSLCEEEVSTLSALVNTKDSALSDCRDSYVNLRQVADTALQQQQAMIVQIEGLNKELKRKTAQSRLLSAAILVLTGVSATLFLVQHKS